ncbi:hypothetical protein [Effusibacillus pohliae]|uniref:hypothetical protein n=1 Tax=Effusibacillus pohliae TaxID=232270 RepID=UPI000381084E|nr:hypothetical protein [Effusibacillus pohliae]
MERSRKHTFQKKKPFARQREAVDTLGSLFSVLTALQKSVENVNRTTIFQTVQYYNAITRQVIILT